MEVRVTTKDGRVFSFIGKENSLWVVTPEKTEIEVKSILLANRKMIIDGEELSLHHHMKIYFSLIDEINVVEGESESDPDTKVVVRLVTDEGEYSFIEVNGHLNVIYCGEHLREVHVTSLSLIQGNSMIISGLPLNVYNQEGGEEIYMVTSQIKKLTIT